MNLFIPKASCTQHAKRQVRNAIVRAFMRADRRQHLTTRHTPHIRKARLQDLDALLQLERSSFTTDLLSRARMRHWIKAPNGILLVATSGSPESTLLGYCLGFMRRNSTTVRMYSLATAAAARGQGIGGLLMQTAVKHARKAGCTRVTLEVAEHNTGAIRLYEQLGYQRFAFVPGFYEDGQNAVRMEKTLKKRG